MALYSTDRERRILGDRTVALAPLFADISSVLEEQLSVFAAEHRSFAESLEARHAEEDDDRRVRLERDEKSAAALRAYRWVFVRLPLRMASGWDDVVVEAELARLRTVLFPLGPPNVVGGSVQLTLDGVTHLRAGIGQGESPYFTAEEVAELRRREDALREAIGDVTKERAETDAARAGHSAKRNAWDASLATLRALTEGFLRQQNRVGEMSRLFTTLPQTAAAGPYDRRRAPNVSTTSSPAPPVASENGSVEAEPVAEPPAEVSSVAAAAAIKPLGSNPA